MKKILHKLKKVNKQIAEFEAELKEIKRWCINSCRPGEKESQIESHEHFIKELKEEKLIILSRLEDAIQIERETILKSFKNDNAPANHETQPSFS